jgi:2-succinyl-6-hydroxy-2,4-cyclohexadiene-1-carboxylate synthase
MINWNTKTIGNETQPLILFLHGFLGSLEDWLEISHKLESRYQSLLIDLPGHGKTRVNRRTDYIMSNVAKALINYLMNHGIKSCHLVGYSMGGRLALYLTINYPDIFKKVILESVNPGLSDRTEKGLRVERDEIIARNIEKSKVDVFLQKWYNLPLFQSLREHPHFDELIDRRQKFSNKNWPNALRGMGLGKQPSLWNKLAYLQNDILILAGEKDKKFSKIAFLMKKYNSGFKIISVKDCGHNVHFECQKEFLVEIENFLQ